MVVMDPSPGSITSPLTSDEMPAIGAENNGLLHAGVNCKKGLGSESLLVIVKARMKEQMKSSKIPDLGHIQHI